MITVGIKTLKNKLSEYVRLAAAGETVLICERDRVVAELGPPERTRAATLPDALLGDLVREGVLTPAPLPPGPPPASHPRMTLDELMKKIDEDRSDR